MEIAPLEIPEVKLIRPVRLNDDRGWFSETYRRDLFSKADIFDDFVQENTSYSTKAGTVRGLHFQAAPSAQAKLVGVLSGAVFDVALDLRRSSPTFLKHVGVRLDSSTRKQLYIPVGFAHGFCTLEDQTILVYKVSSHYRADRDCGIRWNDPSLQIPWPITEAAAILSPKDRLAPLTLESGALFV